MNVRSLFIVLMFLNCSYSLFSMDISKELEELYQADQIERKDFHNFGAEEYEILKGRDHVRRLRVLEIVNDKNVLSGNDSFHAAMIFQHGDTLEDYWMAYSLAKQSVDLGCFKSLWLMAAAYDRWLMKQEKPQKYGTQFLNKGEGWQLWDTDPLTTDEERVEVNVPTLEEQKKRVHELNELSCKSK